MSISSSLRCFSPAIPQSFYSSSHLSKPSFLSPPPWRSPLFSSVSLQKQTQVSSCLSSPSPPSLSSHQLESFPPRLRTIIEHFQSVQQPMAKYEQLLFYGRKLPPLQPQFKIPENKVQGCVSQVWVHAYLDSDRNVRFEADSDSGLTKGLAALLVEGLSGRPPKEILQVSPDFVQLLGLQQSLTPSRNNGFLNMLSLMQKRALQLYVEAEQGGKSAANKSLAAEDPNLDVNSIGSSRNVLISNGLSDNSNFLVDSNSTDSASLSGSRPDPASGADDPVSSAGGLGSRGKRIREMLERELHPVELEVEDISYQHAGHAGVRGHGDGETHFNVRIVAEEFAGKSLVKRHRLVYDILQEELQGGLHALSIVAKTPAEVEKK